MSAKKKEILLNAFTMNCVGHINHGFWTHPRDRSADYTSLAYWTRLAATLERGLFDAVFLADIVGVYDVYEGDVAAVLRESVQLPVNDPTLLVPAMAAVTQHLGFGVTVNVNSEAPYTFARRLSTLDHLTQGRVGWNVVTGYLDSAARAVGGQGLAKHDRRYDQADEYLEVLYKLWEGSWADEALRRDPSARIYADPAQVRPIRHQGEFYALEGYHLSEPSPQRTPVIFQAGASPRGRRFAARHAELVFISGRDKAAVRETARDIRAQAAAQGRRPEDVKILIGISAIPGRTRKEAEEKRAEYLRYASPEGALAHFSASTGIDFSRYGLDEPIAYGESNAIQSATAQAQAQALTRRKLLAQMTLGGRYTALTGTGAEIADELESWIDEGEIDGFNLARIVTPESYEDFVDLVIPELQNRGRFKTAYAEGTLRRKVFGEGDRLSARHPAASSRFRSEEAAET